MKNEFYSRKKQITYEERQRKEVLKERSIATGKGMWRERRNEVEIEALAETKSSSHAARDRTWIIQQTQLMLYQLSSRSWPLSIFDHSSQSTKDSFPISFSSLLPVSFPFPSIFRTKPCFSSDEFELMHCFVFQKLHHGQRGPLKRPVHHLSSSDFPRNARLYARRTWIL